MATFKIITEGTVRRNILVLIESTNNSCQSKFYFIITGNIGDSMSLEYVDIYSTDEHSTVLNSQVITSPFNFISSGEDSFYVYMNNTAIVEDTQLYITVTNNTTLETGDASTDRVSTGKNC
tara:strand:+ start:2513 stop:2875 length:363 start_codon:yes stop_codon:yes gene_type:complete